MQTRTRLFEDLAKVASGAAGSLSGLKAEVEARMRQQFEDMVARLDLVTREDFEAIRAVAVKAREEQEQLERRLAALEAEVARLAATGSSKE